MLIREIKEQDNAVIADIIGASMTEFNADPKTTILGDPSRHTMFQNYQQAGAIYYILEIEGEVVGGSGIHHLDGAPEHLCELQRMFILPEVRGKGYGKLLIDLCIKKAKEFGYKTIYLESLSNMSSALRLYEASGFQKIEKPMGATGHGGCNVFMTLEI